MAGQSKIVIFLIYWASLLIYGASSIEAKILVNVRWNNYMGSQWICWAIALDPTFGNFTLLELVSHLHLLVGPVCLWYLVRKQIGNCTRGATFLDSYGTCMKCYICQRWAFILAIHQPSLFFFFYDGEHG